MKKLIIAFCLCIFIIACTKQSGDIKQIQAPSEEPSEEPPSAESIKAVSKAQPNTEQVEATIAEGEAELIPEPDKYAELPEEVPQYVVVQKGMLLMQLTDKKPELNITSLIVTISRIHVHKAGEGSVSEEICTNKTVINEVCKNVTVNNTIIVCVNQTVIDENCVNITINQTNQIIVNCTNTTRIKEICNNTTNQTIVKQCRNETSIAEECNEEAEGVSGWFTIADEAKTFDLIKLRGVKEFLGSKELDAGRYTQIRLSVDNARLMIGGIEKSLKIPSEKIKLIHSFTIGEGNTTTLTLDFDAQKSVHQAGSKYIMKPTIKVVQG